MAAANANIGVARAAWFPVLLQAAAAGFEGLATSNWISAPARFWAVGPGGTLPLVDAGGRAALNRQARAAYDEAVATYRKTALTAYQEVEDSLASVRRLAEEQQADAAAAKAAQSAAYHADERYAAGVADYIEVTTTHTAALAAQSAALAAQAARLNAAVALVQALGGGWTGDHLNAPALVDDYRTQAPVHARPDPRRPGHAHPGWHLPGRPAAQGAVTGARVQRQPGADPRGPAGTGGHGPGDLGRYRGTRVRGADAVEMRESYELRLMLEIRAVERGLPLKPALAARLEECIREMSAAVADGQSERYIECALQFHRTLMECSANGTFLKLWESLHWDVRGRIALRRMAERGAGLTWLLARHVELMDSLRAAQREPAIGQLTQILDTVSRAFDPG